VLDLETGTSFPVTGTPDEPFIDWFQTPPTWAENNTVFLPTDAGGTLITLEQVS